MDDTPSGHAKNLEAFPGTKVTETAATGGGSGVRVKWTHEWLRLHACYAGAAAGGCRFGQPRAGMVVVGVATVLVHGLRQEVETFSSLSLICSCAA